MTGRLAGKRILVVAGATGVGLACCRRFLAEGACVLLSDLDAGEGARTLAGFGGERVGFIRCDASQRVDLVAAIRRCAGAFGGIDVLVNNAHAARAGDILAAGKALSDQMIAADLKAAVHATQLTAQRMIAQGTGGVIINMSSIEAVLSLPNHKACSMSVSVLGQFTRDTAIALAPHRIRVCGIGPGLAATETAQRTARKDEELHMRRQAWRTTEPEEVAAAAAFLASDDAYYVIGETMQAGGRRLCPACTTEPAQ